MHQQWQVVALGLMFDVSGTCVNLAVAMLASRAATRLRNGGAGTRLLRRATGVIFVGLGLRLALADNR